MFFLAFHSCSQFCPYIAFCLSSIWCARMYVYDTVRSQSKSTHPPIFLLYQNNKNCQIKTNFLSIQTRTNKRFFAMHPFIQFLFCFVWFFILYLLCAIVLCYDFAMYWEWFASFSHEKFKLNFIRVLNGMSTHSHTTVYISS